MSSARSMTCASMQVWRGAAPEPARSQSKTGASSAYTPNFEVVLPFFSGASIRSHGYLQAASSAARVRFSPAEAPLCLKVFVSIRVSRRRVCALPSNPPMSLAISLSAVSPLWPKGGWPRSWDRQAVSTTSGSQPSVAPSSRPTCATSSEWVSRVRTKSSEDGATTWVLAPRRRSAEECSTRARSRSNAVR